MYPREDSADLDPDFLKQKFAQLQAISSAPPSAPPPPVVPSQAIPKASISADSSQDDSSDNEESDDSSSQQASKSSNSSDSEDDGSSDKAADVSQPNIASLKKLQELQQRLNYNNDITQGARLATQGAYAMAGLKNPYDDYYKDQVKQNGAEANQYLQQVDFQKQDPNSPISKQARDLASQFGANPPETVSAADLEKINPMMERLLQSKDAQEARLQAVQIRADTLKENMANRLQWQKMQNDQKLDQKQQQAYNGTVQLLEQMRGSPAVAQAEKDIYAADKAKSIKDIAGGDLNNLSPQMVNLLTSEVGKIASGGQSSQAELAAITPATLRGQFAHVWGNLTNNPTPANAGKFLQQYMQYADQIKGDAQKVITDRYGRIIHSRGSQFSPDQYQNLQDQYINRFVDPIPQANKPAQPDQPKAAPKGDNSAPMQQSAPAQQSKDPKVDAFAQQNKLDYGTAFSILKSRGVI